MCVCLIVRLCVCSFDRAFVRLLACVLMCLFAWFVYLRGYAFACVFVRCVLCLLCVFDYSFA